MALRLTWSPAARTDLRELRAYIAESDPAAARRFVQSIFDAAQRLCDFPESGRVVPEFGDPNLREIIRRPCRVVYRIRPGKISVQIVRVWHAARGEPEI